MLTTLAIFPGTRSDLVSAIAQERGATLVSTKNDYSILTYQNAHAALRSAFDFLERPEFYGTARIAVTETDSTVSAETVAQAVDPGTVAITAAVRKAAGARADSFVPVDTGALPEIDAADLSVFVSGPGATALPDIRVRLLTYIRDRGGRPTRAEAIEHLGVSSPAELSELDRLGTRGFLRREDDHELAADPVPEKPYEWDGSLRKLLKGNRSLSDFELYELYRSTFERRISRERAGLAGHTTSFLGVNAMITVVWAITGAGFPWFLFPLFGWGIGYISHLTAQRSRQAEYAEVELLAGATRDDLKTHRKLWKQRRSWRGHLASNLATMGLLGMINAITSPGFPWALIPSAAMGIGLFTHFASYRRRVAELEPQIPLSTFPRKRFLTKTAGEPMSSFLAGARATQRQIEDEIAALPEAAALGGDDLHTILDTYVSQLEVLDRTQREVRELLAGIPIQQLNADRSRLTERLGKTENKRVEKEYRASLEQIERQRRSYDELSAELEVIEVRSGAALNALNQIKIDVIRTKNTRAQMDLLESLRAQAGEISVYLEDLRSGYEELS